MPRLSKIGAAALAAFGWTSGTSAVTASYLVVAGGGAGGGSANSAGQGGGGAGGYLTGTTSLSLTTSYTVIVGAGGAAVTTTGTQGGNSQFGTLTASVGGGGGGDNNAATPNGSSGGSGGGGSYAGNGASGTSGQGTAGGNGNTASPYPGGGGGGAGASGGNATGSGLAGAGGVGLASSISGTSTYYAGGGGGGVRTGGTAGAGGNGGGGQGSNTNDNNGQNATQNTGGGGGGSSQQGTTVYGGRGGSGVVIISYAGAQQFSGGIVTSVGGNTIHTFTTSGTLGPITTLSASYLIVAGGGGGGSRFGGGGGAGGLLSGSGVTIDSNSTYLVTVGAGGTGGAGTGGSGTSGANDGANGTNSTFSMVSTTAIGGGGGGAGDSRNGLSGGSGGGGAGRFSSTGGSATSGQGNAGANSNGAQLNGQDSYRGSGGGGASAAGTAGVNVSPYGGIGGAGTASSISGSSVTYAGGGGGGQGASGSVVIGGTGGAGGGGNGGSYDGSTLAQSGTANTGGGGGGGGYNGGSTTNYAGGNGGSGVVIISYAGSTQQMAGGTVTIVGGNVIHTFTSTGYLSPLKYSTGSLRFRSSNSAYLSRTPTVTGSRTTWTYSAWVKVGTLGLQSELLNCYYSSDNKAAYFRWNSDNTLTYFDYNSSGGTFINQITTTQVLRDPAAWYHLVMVYDTSNATSSDRLRLYINGVRVTSFSTANYPSSSYAGTINTTSLTTISKYSAGASGYFDGEMTEINFVDGQALTPNSFGTFNSYGVWQPITYGGSYGTNGFYLPFNRQAVSYVGSFNGSSQYLTVADATPLQPGSGSWCVECYVCLNTASGIMEIINKGYGYQIYTQSGNWNIALSSGNNTSYFGQFIFGAIVANTWQHLALTYDGTTYRAFLNGTLRNSLTSATLVSTGSSAVTIGAFDAGNNYNTNGYISNVRFVKGSAVYTSNFTPSTSALTAITGTQLLTLQNSSIIDNSTNGYSVTNTGGVSTGQTYPFAYGIFNDQGPAGNNWTPTNISGAFGTTLDYLGDAPTLTSATVANYCVINPLDKGTSATVTNGNLRLNNAFTGSPYPSARASIGVSSGKWYWEVTCTTISGDSPSVGIGNALGNIQQYTGYDANSWGYIFATGAKGNNNNTSQAYGATVSTGDVVGVALDMDAGTLTFYKNGTSQGVAFTGLTGTMFPWGFAYNNSILDFNFGQQPFKYTPPSNHIALNTYNL